MNREIRGSAGVGHGSNGSHRVAVNSAHAHSDITDCGKVGGRVGGMGAGARPVGVISNVVVTMSVAPTKDQSQAIAYTSVFLSK